MKSYKMKDILLQGIPYDEKSSFLKGASLAPAIIRDKFWSKSSNTFSTYLNGNKDWDKVHYTFLEYLQF